MTALALSPVRPHAGQDAASRTAGRERDGVRERVLQFPAMRAVPHVDAGGPLRQRHLDVGQRHRDVRVGPHPRPLSAGPGLPHRALRQDALHRSRPGARVQRAHHHRHLSRQLRMDAGTGSSASAIARPVSTCGRWWMPGFACAACRSITTRKWSSPAYRSCTTWLDSTRTNPSCCGSPSPTPIRRSSPPGAIGTATTTTPSTCLRFPPSRSSRWTS